MLIKYEDCVVWNERISMIGPVRPAGEELDKTFSHTHAQTPAAGNRTCVHAVRAAERKVP